MFKRFQLTIISYSIITCSQCDNFAFQCHHPEYVQGIAIRNAIISRNIRYLTFSIRAPDIIASIKVLHHIKNT